MSLLDIIVIILLIINLAQGYQKGMIWTIFSLASYIIAFLGAKWYHVDLSIWVQNNTGILDKIKGLVDGRSEGLFEKFFINGLGGESASTGLWKWMDQYLVKEASIDMYANQGIEMLKEEIIVNIATYILNILCLLFLFFIIRALMMLAGRVCNQLFKLPLLSTVNQMGGLVIGACKGLIMVVITYMIFLSMAMASPDGWAAGLIEKSVSIELFFKYGLPLIMPKM